MSRASSTVRSLPYPALEDGNFSFPEGDYSVTANSVKESSTAIILQHSVAGAPLIEGLIVSGDAKFACLVSVPKTGYRKLEIADGYEQIVSWDLDIVGEPPLLGPVVLYVGKGLDRELRQADGVAEIWRGRNVVIPKGARLAKGRYLRRSGSMQSLLHVQCDSAMKHGSFRVAANSDGGFYFTIYAAPDVFGFLQNPQGNPGLRASILTHAVSRCLEILKADYKGAEDGEDDNQWTEYQSLKALSDWLASKGQPHWSHDNFDPVKVATELYPIHVPVSSDDD